MRKMLLDQEMSFEEIRGHYPQISLAYLATFKENEDTPEERAKQEWGKSMRDKNIGHHNLGTCGFLGKQPIWDKEDATRPPGVENPWEKFKDPLARRMIRAWYHTDKETGKLKT